MRNTANRFEFYDETLYDEIQLIIGQLFTHMRKERKLTQLGLGQRIHCSQSSLCRFEQGEVFRDMRQVMKLCAYFQISYMELFQEALQLCYERREEARH